jgi:hypothetical protein
MNNPFPTFTPIFEKGTISLSFLHLYSDDLSDAFAFIRNACENSKNVSNEIMSLLAENDWRPHLVAAAAILIQKKLPSKVYENLWRAFDKGSWVSPQLAVVAWLRDSNFEVSAKQRIHNGCPQNTKQIDELSPIERHVIAGPASNSGRSAKALAALIYLVGLSEGANGWLMQELQRDEIKTLLKQDEDFGGTIAEKWLSSLRLKSSNLGLEID